MVDNFILWCAMGGYWPYVWPAYAVTALILIGNGFRLYRSMRK